MFDVFVVNDQASAKVSLSDVVHNPHNEVVYLGWEGERGEEYRIIFNEEGLSNASIKDGNLVIEDTEGDDIEISFTETKKHYLVIEEID